MTVLEYLREKNISISAPCGGNGTCGRCRVSIDGGPPVRACMTEYRDGMEIRVIDDFREMEILTGNGIDKAYGADSGRYGIAIDIGSTTIAGVLCDTGSGRVAAKASMINPNTSYGADVISRIRAASEGHGKEMREDLLAAVKQIVIRLGQGIKMSDIKNDAGKKTTDMIVLSGNTAMIHILMGYDTAGLGVFPYEPVNTGMISGTAGDLLEIETSDISDKRCVIFPGASAFIGGDIISGAYYLEGLGRGKRTGDIIAFIDLGTNGEMALITPEKIYCASAAAGPVFEGGGISCGTASVPGAIDHVDIDGDGGMNFSTIGDVRPVTGICGSGIIDCASEMYRMGLCDEYGTFAEDEGLKVTEYPGGDVSFTQQDMRQVQLAKAAISAGLEVLCRWAGIAYPDIATLYLAGGMGYAVGIDQALNIGLLPKELRGRIEAAGNTSLKGAVRLLCGDASEAGALSRLVSRSVTIDLASDPSFQESYISHINLP